MLNQIIGEIELFIASTLESTLAESRPLTHLEQVWAAESGVIQPAEIRLKEVSEIPKPKTRLLMSLVEQLSLIDSTTAGITFGNFVLICRGHYSERLLRHEFRHVQQWNTFQTNAEFLNAYLSQVLEFGYFLAPFEVDARSFETKKDSKHGVIPSPFASPSLSEPWRPGHDCREHTGFYIELRPLPGFSAWHNYWPEPPYFAYLQGVLLDYGTDAVSAATLLTGTRSQIRSNRVVEGTRVTVPTRTFEFRVVAVRDGHDRYSKPERLIHLPAWGREQVECLP